MARITVDPNVHFGKPSVAGTCIPVKDVLELVREGIPFDVITTDYFPDLDRADIQACLQYAINIVEIEDIQITTSTS